MEAQSPGKSTGLATALAMMNGFGALVAFVIAAMLVLTALAGAGSGARASERALPLVTLGWVSGLVGLLLLIGLAQAVARINGRVLPMWTRLGSQRTATILFIVGWPLVLLGGQALSTNPTPLSLWLLPLCLILAIGLPLLWMLDLTLRGLKVPAHRAWGVSSVVMAVGLPLAVLVELFFVILGVFMLAGMLSGQPEVLRQIQALTRELRAGQVDPDALQRVFEPLLSQPMVVFAILAGISVIVPLVEELVKPLGLWFLAPRGFSPAQGFALGAVSGATFALVESLATLSSVTGGDWLLLVIGRAGTLLLHIACSALVGWGLGLAWTRARYAQFAGLFLAALAIHGVWNGLAQFMGLMPFINPGRVEMSLPMPAEIAIVVVLGLMVIGSLVLLMLLNRRLNREQAREEAAAAQAASAVVPPYPPDALGWGGAPIPPMELPGQSAPSPEPETHGEENNPPFSG